LQTLEFATVQEDNTIYNKTVLDNGIRVVTEQIPHVRSVSIGVWIDVGSRDETVENNGISHFLEHMVFKGTKHRKAHQIAQSLESVGGYINAFTSKEHTCYYARVLDEHIERAIDVLSDIIQHPLFDEKELEKEKLVVLEELRNEEDEPDELVHDYFERNLFSPHPLSFTVLGTKENIIHFSQHDLRTYLQEHYTMNRTVIAAAGHLEHQNVVQLVQEYFRYLPNGQNEFPRLKMDKKRHISKTEEISKPINQAHVCLGTKIFGVRNKQRYPLLVLNTLLGDGMSSRLYQNIREKHGIAYSIYSFANLMSDIGSFGVYVGTDKKHIASSIELVGKELDKLKVKSISNAELQRTKEQLKGSMMLSLESMSNRMMRLGRGELYYHSYTTLDSIIKRIDSVTAEEINEVANQLFQENNFSAVIFKPTD